jgi:hypothetical protein
MKKYLAVVLGAAVVAAPAFASKARLQALGEDIYGSFYVDDNRNIFRNASLINEYNNFVTFEWGNNNKALDDAGEGTATGGAAAFNNLTGPRSEGGVFMKHGNLVYGVYLGDVANDSHIMRVAGLGAGNNAAANEQNNVSLWLGGEAGVKWGASLVYSSSNDDAAAAAGDQKSQDAMRLRLGVSKDNWEAFSTINLGNEVETGDDAVEFKGKIGYQVGGIYKMNDYRFYAVHRNLEGEGKTNEFSLSSTEIGVGRQEKLNAKTTLFTKVSLNMLKTENDGSTSSLGAGVCTSGAASVVGCEEYKSTRVPVTIGLETRATDWLSIRGSVGQNLYGMEEDNADKRSMANSTLVAAGATLHFGDFEIDGVVGNNDDGQTPAASGTSTGLGQLRTDVIMSRVAMTYRF